jgi:(p)ppGpp synthase/HD superfamily hydrolase
MTSQTASSPRLTPTFVQAVQYAAEKHATQTRKGSGVPYLGHLLSVAGYVIEADGTQTEAIAAMLHDAVEDQGGEATLAEIREKRQPMGGRDGNLGCDHSSTQCAPVQARAGLR